MTYKFKSESDARSTASFLRVAAEMFDKDALVFEGVNLSMARQFRLQALEARRLSDEITEQVG